MGGYRLAQVASAVSFRNYVGGPNHYFYIHYTVGYNDFDVLDKIKSPRQKTDAKQISKKTFLSFVFNFFCRFVCVWLQS